MYDFSEDHQLLPFTVILNLLCPIKQVVHFYCSSTVLYCIKLFFERHFHLNNRPFVCFSITDNYFDFELNLFFEWSFPLIPAVKIRLMEASQSVWCFTYNLRSNFL